jgi:hypothetical protein
VIKKIREKIGFRFLGADAGGLENKNGKDNDKDSEIGDAGGVLRAFGADAGGLENKDKNDRDGDSKNGDAGGVLRASGADTDGVENKDRQDVDDDDDDDDDNCERGSNTDGRGGKPGVVT